MHFVKTSIGVAAQAFDGKCRSNERGHAPHAIQLRKAFELSRTPVGWIGADSASSLKLEVEGVIRYFYNHHPETIKDLIDIHRGSGLFWVEDFGVLILDTEESVGFAFSLSSKALTECH